MFIAYIFIKALYLNTKQCDRGAIKKEKKNRETGNMGHTRHENQNKNTTHYVLDTSI